jgi:hypothetical protein
MFEKNVLRRLFRKKGEEIQEAGENCVMWSFLHTGLFKKKYTLSKIYFTKTTDAKSMFCVRTERKSLEVLI